MHSSLQGPHTDIKAEGRQTGSGARALTRVVVGLWGTQAKAKMVKSNQKELGFGERHRGLF